MMKYRKWLIMGMALAWVNAAAIEKDSEGTYLIGSTADYEEFCDIVFTGNPYANAKVTADGIEVKRCVGIGTEEFHYRGTFDGQGHTMVLNLNNTNNWNNGFGMFQHTRPGCVIRNLHITGTVTSSQKFAGTLVGSAVGTTIENCISSATLDVSTISGDATAGGLVGWGKAGETTFENCAFIGVMKMGNRPSSAALMGWSEQAAQVKSCYVAATFITPDNSDCDAFARNIDTAHQFVGNNYVADRTDSVGSTTFPAAGKGTSVSLEAVKSGELCYRLNAGGRKGAVWMQNGDFPQPFATDGAMLVVKSGDSYNQVSACAHTFENHICTACGSIEDGAIVEPLQKTTVSSSDATVNNIKYGLRTDGTASVKGIDGTVKAIAIPEHVTVSDKQYKVTRLEGYSMSSEKMEFVSIPATINSIDDDAFHESYSLIELHIADAPTPMYIGRCADFTFVSEEMFYNTKLEKVYIGRNLTWNGDNGHDEPFEDRERLEEIYFGPRVTSVGNHGNFGCTNNQLFNDCGRVKKYAFLGDEKSMGTSLKFDCSEGMSHASQAYINRDIEASKYTEYTLNGSGWGISDQLVNVTYGPFVTWVTAKMYSGYAAQPNAYLKTVDFSNARNLTTIQERAFADCDYVERVDFSKTKLTTIEKEGFYDCDKLSSVHFGFHLETVGQSAFDDVGIIQINLPGTLKRLGYKAFYDCDEAEELLIMPGKGDITCEDDGGECRTFDSSSNLKKLYLGRNMKWNGTSDKGSPFYDSYFEGVAIDDSVTYLGQYMFNHSNKLHTLSIGKGITSIPGNCFFSTSDVTTVTIADSPEPITIGASFADFKTHFMHVGRVITDYGNIPHGMESGSKVLERISFGSGVKELWSWALKDYPALKSVELPAGIKVKSNAFVNCGIDYLYARGDAYFETEAVKQCNHLKNLMVMGECVLEENAFAPSKDAKAPENIMVNFAKDPGEESHPQSFPQKYLDESALTNLFDSPYKSITFSALPWSGFKIRKNTYTHDYISTDSAVANGNYDHAYIRAKQSRGGVIAVSMPFDVSTYYFSPDAAVYEIGINGFIAAPQSENIFLAKDSANLDNQYYFKRNQPYIIFTHFPGDMIQGSFDQFKRSTVLVDYQAPTEQEFLPYFYSNKAEVLSPEKGDFYVVDNSLLKRVNGDYELPAFHVAIKSKSGEPMHLYKKGSAGLLIRDNDEVTAVQGLRGYATFLCTDSHLAVEGAEVYVLRTVTNQRGNSYLAIEQVTDGIINQGQAVLIKMQGYAEELNMQMVTSPSTNTELYEANVLKGVVNETPVADLGDAYVLGANKGNIGFWHVGDAATSEATNVLGARRAYILATDVPDSALPVIIEGGPTGIGDVNATDARSRAYDILGRPVHHIESGNIYIQNGEKIIKK
ncbi:MAG: leucine-rich repeat protein [Bacteroidales bacterium]|nr:leucine-rich repeat protein [Bacteroidales bacterium]